LAVKREDLGKVWDDRAGSSLPWEVGRGDAVTRAWSCKGWDPALRGGVRREDGRIEPSPPYRCEGGFALGHGLIA